MVKLHLEMGEQVYRLKTIRSIKGTAFAVCYSCIPSKWVPDLEEYLEDFHSVNQIFSDYYGYDKPSCDNITIEAVPPQADLLKYFDIPEGIPILSINCSFSTEKKGPIEYFMIKARSDIFKFTMDFNENR